MTVRRRLLTVVAIFATLLVLVPFLWWQFLGPERFDGLDLGAAPDGTLSLDDLHLDESARRLALLAGRDLSEGDVWVEPVVELPPLNLAPSVRVTLMFSVGSSGMTRREANRLRIADVGDRGGDKLTDSIMLLVSDVPSGQAALVSIPRDLWLSSRGHRINESFVRFGIQGFVDDVSKVSGLPIHSVVQVNFTAFADLVEAVGGVALQVKAPMADLYSILYVPQAGCWRFDGASALAWARSRHTLTTTNGTRWRGASTADDISRMARQQGLLTAAWDQVRGPGFVKRLPDLLRLADGLTIDRGLGIDDVVSLARSFQDVAAGRVEGHILPTVPRRVGAAQVQSINWNRALAFYERLRSWPPGHGTQAAPEPSPASSSSASPTPSPASSAQDGSSPPGTRGPDSPITQLTERPSEEPTPEPTPEPSQTPSPAAPSASPSQTPSGESSPPSSSGSKTPRATSGCTRSTAWELPSNPLDYLAAIANRDPVPPYTPHRRGETPAEPEPESSADPEEDPAPTTAESPADGSGDPEPGDPEPGDPGSGDPATTGDQAGDDPGAADANEDPGGGSTRAAGGASG